MTSTTPAATPVAEPVGRHRATSWDRWAIIGLGIAGCALSYDALVQMATAIHTRHPLTYLFPIVIDGFIAYGVRALLVLRNAPLRARLYVWALFIAATAASIWANCLHAVALNQPDAVTLHLDDTTVAILSAIAPLALAGATHLHILITRYGHPTGQPHHPVPPATDNSPPHPAIMIPAAPANPAAPGRIPATPKTPPSPAGTADPAPPQRQDTGGNNADSIGTDTAAAGNGGDACPGEAARTGRPGRRADASITHLAEVIAAAHPASGRITRAMARTAIEAAGLSAGNQRIKEALRLLQPKDTAFSHPSAD